MIITGAVGNGDPGAPIRWSAMADAPTGPPSIASSNGRPPSIISAVDASPN